MLLNLLMSGLQILFVILFVAVWKLELVGSALAVNLGFCICAVIALVPFLLGKSVLKFRKPKFSAAILTVSTAIVFPLLMVVLLWILGLDGLWLNQAATYIPVDIIAFVMLRKTPKTLAPEMR